MARSKKKVVVTVSDAALKNIQGVVDRLTAKGMKVEQVLPVMGVISGSLPVSKKSALRSVEGVHSVEDEAEVQLPPPDSEIQ